MFHGKPTGRYRQAVPNKRLEVTLGITFVILFILWDLGHDIFYDFRNCFFLSFLEHLGSELRLFRNLSFSYTPHNQERLKVTFPYLYSLTFGKV
jgi:hypothetical protein